MSEDSTPTGRVVKVAGPVIDVEFPPDALPEINTALEVGRDHGLNSREVELTNAREIRERAPSPYGVFSIVVDGEVLSHYYQPAKKLNELLEAHLEGRTKRGSASDG